MCYFQKRRLYQQLLKKIVQAKWCCTKEDSKTFVDGYHFSKDGITYFVYMDNRIYATRKVSENSFSGQLPEIIKESASKFHFDAVIKYPSRFTNTERCELNLSSQKLCSLLGIELN